MKLVKIILFLITILFSFISHTSIMAQKYTIMTYNVENLFDTKHDTLKNDVEYLPSSEKHWTKNRFFDKLHEIMQVIVGTGSNEPPVIVGLCEIENDYVLNVMTRFEPYNQLGYDYVHFESPDKRGIDVAILYQKNFFTPLISRPIKVTLPNGKAGRDILYVSGTTPNGSILHLFQVHFPSRREGVEFSEPNRIAVAKIIKDAVDSIQNTDMNAGIILMGDFNDNPSDFVPTEVLNAQNYNVDEYKSDILYNLCYDGKPYEDRDKGTYFHAGEWDMLDQIIVSGSLLNGSLPMKISKPAEIFAPKWISHYDKKNLTYVPNRTYKGTHYSGGTSDHFPLFIELILDD